MLGIFVPLLLLLSRLKELPWHMVFVGDGYAREAMMQRFQALAYNSLQPFSVNVYKDRYLTVRHTLILKSQS